MFNKMLLTVLDTIRKAALRTVVTGVKPIAVEQTHWAQARMQHRHWGFTAKEQSEGWWRENY